ncbi:uncharacterized protein LOC108910385 [Anoplophora glabripennis]|uniref:uncharacterized protein LOC108910385 n=1 Tax=Anoplophora glabripennis TaxID=217634 RepID=UPI000C78111D|nr:uncharacterized protein LOC108910385 [Anoplophora glabripennis]
MELEENSNLSLPFVKKNSEGILKHSIYNIQERIESILILSHPETSVKMDIHSRKIELKSEIQCDEHTQITSKAVKRPFDVAFLMLPDEKLKQKQSKIAKNITFEKELEVSYNNNDEDEEIEVEDTPREYKLHQKFFTQKQQIFDDPNLIKPKNLEDLRSKSLSSPSDQKSAFTKVNLSTKEPRVSPGLSASPELSYQNSLSPSPPIINRNYQNFPTSMLSPSQIFKNQQITAYQNQFLPENFHHPSGNLENTFFKTQPELIQPNFAKMRPMYRPDLTYNYHQFPNQDMLKMAQPDLKFPADIRNPAAAILTSLLPPSLAALSLPAQNVCAKCNISFRMTSDLVYHMRSHHKSEATDMNKRRREEKLKCPVCAESFRERHHLTRHMTAHQDKDDDDKDVK